MQEPELGSDSDEYELNTEMNTPDSTTISISELPTQVSHEQGAQLMEDRIYTLLGTKRKNTATPEIEPTSEELRYISKKPLWEGSQHINYRRDSSGNL